MSRNRPIRQPPNMKNGVNGGVDIPKRQVQQRERGYRYGVHKWHVGGNISHISSTYHITRMQFVLLAVITGVAAATGGIDCEFLPGIVDDHATPHVCSDRNDTDPHITVVTPPNGEPDASANSVLAAMADPILQRTGQWIRNDAKNVVCQQMSRSMRKLSLGRR